MSKSILVVEDEKILRISLADALKAEGYTVFPVADGNEGLAVLGEGDFSLVITDIRLPGRKRHGYSPQKSSRSTAYSGDHDDRLRYHQGRGFGHSCRGL